MCRPSCQRTRDQEPRVLASSLVILRQLFQPFPLLLVMTENHQPDLLPFDQIKQFHPTSADRFGVRVAPVVLLVTGKALAEGDRVNRQDNRPPFWAAAAAPIDVPAHARSS